MFMTERPLRFGGFFPPFPLSEGGSRLDRAEKLLDRRIEIAMWYQWWDTGFPLSRKARDFQPRWADAAGDRDVLIKWEPWRPGRVVAQPEFAVGTIFAGNHDAYILRWAQRIREWKRPVYLCPMPEPNGFWNGWSAPVGGHTAADYVAAWRHIHRLFCNEGAANTRRVWNPNAGDQPEDNRMEAYYPGSDVVDVLGLSVYNWGAARSWSHWRSFEEIARPYYDRIAELGDQPIWIAEMGCAPEGGDRVAWIRELFNVLPTMSRLEAIVWFDMKKETDWRITSDPLVAREFRTNQGRISGS
jgi:mannan endo-1,4-beta-mannosidase